MFDYLSLNSEKILLITPSNLKNKIREEIMSYNKLLNIKIMSIEEIKNRLFFEPTNQTFTTIYYKYKKPLSIINTLINYLYYIDINKTYSYAKINELKDIKNYLFTNNLVKRDSRFIYNLKQYKVCFLGFNNIDKENDFVINMLKKHVDVEMLDYCCSNYNPTLTHLHTIEEEILYVADSISKLLENNIDINNIKLCNINDDYLFYIKRIFTNYNIPINLNEKISLYSLPLSSLFINLLKEKTKEETILFLKENYLNYLDYINLYISILNKYAYLEDLDLNLITYELKNTYIKPKQLNNAIDIIDIDEIGNSDHYIFVMSCNYNYFPKIIKDEEYLLDIEKDEIGLSTSKEINKNNKTSLLKLIHSSKNIYLSYKDISYFNEYHPVDFLDIQENNFYIKNHLESYSENEDKILLTKYLDNNLINDVSLLLNSNYSINYLMYDNKFKGFDINLLHQVLKEKPLTISYSSLNQFYTCPYSYYIEKILNISTFEDSVYTVIGKIMHDIVESCYNPDFDFEKAFLESKNKHINNINFKDSELFFIDNIKERTLNVVNFLRKNEMLTKLNIHDHEVPFNFYKDIEGHKVKIKGFIDKIIYQTINDILYCAIVDLKTGSDIINPNKFEFGLSLQLPFYIYLMRNDNQNRYNNSEILGIYIHNILNKINDDDTLKYNGYTLKDLTLLSLLDSTYESSTLIKSLRIKKDGDFDSNSKLMTKDELEKLSSLVENKIKEMVKSIYNCDFKIYPKIIEKEDVSCSFCPYSSICYKTSKDYTYLKYKKGGNNDA